MNEKYVWELWSKCKHPHPKYGGGDMIFPMEFAELIVRECADICYHHSNAAGGVDTHFGYGYKDCGDDIKRNFGVEE